MKGFACRVQVGLAGRPFPSADSWSEFHRSRAIVVIDAVDACHQSAQFTMIHLVEHVELDGSAVLNVECHHARLAVGIAFPPDVVQGIERVADDGHRVV